MSFSYQPLSIDVDGVDDQHQRRGGGVNGMVVARSGFKFRWLLCLGLFHFSLFPFQASCFAWVVEFVLWGLSFDGGWVLFTIVVAATNGFGFGFCLGILSFSLGILSFSIGLGFCLSLGLTLDGGWC